MASCSNKSANVNVSSAVFLPREDGLERRDTRKGCRAEQDGCGTVGEAR